MRTKAQEKKIASFVSQINKIVEKKETDKQIVDLIHLYKQ